MTYSAPNWLQHLLGLGTEPGEGVAWGMEHAWPWPAWATLLFLIAAGALVVTLYRRDRHASRAYRMLLAAIRLALVAIVVLMIAQVTLSLRRTGLPSVAVLVDDSQSMMIVDHYAQEPAGAMRQRLKQSGLGGAELSRWNLLQTLLSENDRQLLRGMADSHRLRVYYLTGVRPSREHDVSGTMKELSATSPRGESTRLGAAVRSVLDDLRGTAPAAMVVLSDGINTDGPPLAEAAEYARRQGVPLYFIGLGSDRPRRELRLSDLLVDDVVFVDDVVNFELKLMAGGFEGRKVAIVLREKNNPAVLSTVVLAAGPDGRPQQVRLPLRPTKVGQLEYVITAEPQDGQPPADTNRLTGTLQVRKEKIRVLLVQGSPSFEFRYLRNMLQRDETISLRTVLQDADPEHLEQDASALRGFPLKREELFAYDVVILGDANPALLSAAALKNLAEFVDQPGKGGALVLIAGPSYMPAAYRDTPLARLFPFSPQSTIAPSPSDVLTQGFVVQPTELGLASPPLQLGDSLEETRRIWQSLAPLYWLLEVPEVKPGVRVLAEHPTRLGPDGRRLPVIMLQYVGAGKVLFHATDESWRWRYRVGDAWFARYWVQMIRYLCRSKLADGGQPVTLMTDRRQYAQGEPVQLHVRFADERFAPAADDGVAVVVELSGGKSERITLNRTGGRGIFEGTLDHLAPGDYHAWIATPVMEGRSAAADFRVAPPAGEFAQTQMDAAEMRRAAERSGGRFYTFDTAAELLDELPPGRQLPIETLPPRPLWNRWPVLALFLGLLTAEWVLRKRSGMV